MAKIALLRRFQDLGTGRLPADSELDNRRYLVMATIGKGGMGAVYLARDTHMNNQLVAIKEMSQANLNDPGALHRARQSFQQEARMLEQLHHPNLPRVYASFQESNRSYLVMEYIEGKTLAETLRQGNNALLLVQTTLEYGLQLSSVLSYLHTLAQPIIYLDLKPLNVMLRKNSNRLVLIDFGIARFYRPGLVLPANEAFFTPGYAPPEQMVGQPEPRSDLFALGATLHQCLTRQNPQAHTRERVFDFPPILPLNPQAPETLCLLVDQLLSVDQQRRPASALLVQQRLTQIQDRLIRPIVLRGQTVSADPDAPTVSADPFVTPNTPLTPRTSNWVRVGQLFPQLAQQGQRLGFSLARFGRQGVVPALLNALSKPWQQGRDMLGNQKIWDQRFAAVLLGLLVLILGGSLAFLKASFDAPHIHILGLFLLLAILGVIGFHLSGKRLYDPIPRALLSLMGLTLIFTGLILQSLPDTAAVIEPLVQNATLNQLVMLGMVILAAISLTRPEKSLAWVDYVLLGLLAAGDALWQYSFGQSELAQFPGFSPDLSQYVNTSLIWGLLALALLLFLLGRHPSPNWFRFFLFLIAGIFAAFQYTSGFDEFQAFQLTGLPLTVLSFSYIYLPVLCAFLALCTRRISITRVAFCLLVVAEVTMLAYQGKHAFFSFLPTTPYPLSLNVLTSPTLSQLLTPLLVLVALLTLFSLPGKSSFRWLDHAGLLLAAFLCAHLEEAYWQAHSPLSTSTPDQAIMHQQYISLLGLLPAYLTYVLLWIFPLALIAITVCHFWRQSRPYARVEPWLHSFRTILTLTERLLTLALLAIACLLPSSPGIFTLFTQISASQSLNTLPVTPLAFLLLFLAGTLLVLALILIIRLLRRKASAQGNSERLALLAAVSTCLLLTWLDPRIATLSLLNQPLQFAGNFFHWSPVTLSLLLLSSLVLISCLAFVWLRRSFFVRYRALLNSLFVLALLCAFLQLAWPIFLPLGLLCLLPGILLAVQIEKAG